MGSNSIGRTTMERSEGIGPRIAEKLSDPAVWAWVAVKALIGSIITATISISVPVASMTALAMAVACAVSAAVFATIALALFANRKYEFFSAKLFVNGREITDPEQIELFKQFSPKARECIDNWHLCRADTKDLQWDGDQLNHFKPKEIQLLLNKFGEQFSTLDFTNYAKKDRLKSLNTSNCPNLLFLVFEGKISVVPAGQKDAENNGHD